MIFLCLSVLPSTLTKSDDWKVKWTFNKYWAVFLKRVTNYFIFTIISRCNIDPLTGNPGYIGVNCETAQCSACLFGTCEGYAKRKFFFTILYSTFDFSNAHHLFTIFNFIYCVVYRPSNCVCDAGYVNSANASDCGVPTCLT